MLCAVLVGCGPSVPEEALEIADACGAQGPVQLVETEVPASSVWGSAVTGDRRVAAWFNPSFAEESELSNVFGAYVLDACGGNEIALSERQYPLVVGDAAFTCDPLDGSIRPLNLDTGASGEALGSGYDCNPWLRWSSTLVMRNLDANAFGLLRSDGVRLLPTSLSEANAGLYASPHAAYLSRWGTHGGLWEDEDSDYWAWSHDERVTALEVATGELHPLPEGTRWVFGVEDGRDLWVFLEPDADGRTQTLRLATLASQPQPGPAFDDVDDLIWAAHPDIPSLLLDDSILLVEREQSVPRPAFLQPGAWQLVRLDATRFVQGTQEEIIVWDAETGSAVLRFEPPAPLCGNVLFHPSTDTLSASFSDDACVTHTHRLFPLDGSPPLTIAVDGADRNITYLPGGGFALTAPSHRGAGDLTLLALDADATRTLAPDINGLAHPPHLPLPRQSPGTDGTAEFYVREGDRAGLWLVGTP